MPWLGFTERGVVLAFELPVSLGVLDWMPQVNAAKWRWHYLGLLFLLVGLRANAKTTREKEREGEEKRGGGRDSATAALAGCFMRLSPQAERDKDEGALLCCWRCRQLYSQRQTICVGIKIIDYI